MAFGFPSKDEIGAFLAAVYRVLMKIGKGQPVDGKDPDMQTLKTAIEKLGVTVE